MKILKRIFLYPFLLPFFLITIIKLVVMWSFNWFKYGGEVNIYHHGINQNTLATTYLKLEEILAMYKLLDAQLADSKRINGEDIKLGGNS